VMYNLLGSVELGNGAVLWLVNGAILNCGLRITSDMSEK